MVGNDYLNERKIGFRDYIYRGLWSTFLLFFFLYSASGYGQASSEESKSMVDLSVYMSATTAVLIIIWNLLRLITKLFKKYVLNNENTPEPRTRHEEVMEMVDEWVLSLKFRLMPHIPVKVKVETLGGYNKKLSSWWRFLRVNIFIPYPILKQSSRTGKTKIGLKNKGTLIAWVFVIWAWGLKLITPIECIIIIVASQFIASEINRRVLFNTIWYSFRYGLEFIKLSGVFGAASKLNAQRVLMKVHEDTETHAKESVFASGEPIKQGLPPLSLLGELGDKSSKVDDDLENQVNRVFENLGMAVKLKKYVVGATITKAFLEMDVDVRIKNILTMKEDIAMLLHVDSINIYASSEGMIMEIPNKERRLVTHREVMEKLRGQRLSELGIVIGERSAGDPFWFDLSKLPHLLIAGATNQGKSVCLNTIIATLLLRRNPKELQFLLIDPKQVEFTMYENMPHLARKVVKGANDGIAALEWCIQEMERRYAVLSELKVKKLHDIPQSKRPFPLLIIIIDELADLILTAGKEVDQAISRLAGKARAAGMHLIVATQRPDATILSGLIRSNIIGRIALKTNNTKDSTIILDQPGAENLLGNGEMLIKIPGLMKVARCQGSFIKDEDIENIVKWWKENWNQGASIKTDIDIEDIEIVEELEIVSNNGMLEIANKNYDLPELPGPTVDRQQEYTEKLRSYVMELHSKGYTHIPGQQKIAAALHCDVRKVAASVKELRELGLLKASEKRGQGDEINIKAEEGDNVSV